MSSIIVTHSAGGPHTRAAALFLTSLLALASAATLTAGPRPGKDRATFTGLNRQGGFYSQIVSTNMGMAPVGVFPGPSIAGPVLALQPFARGLSADGQVVVGYVGDSPGSPSAPRQAFRWTQVDGLQLIPKNAPYTDSAATGVSADGAVIVGNHSFGALRNPFRWTLNGGTVDLPLGAPPAGAAAPDTRALGVSDDGNVVVGDRYACKFFGDEAWWATRWVGQAPPAPMDLGHLPEVVSPCDDRYAWALDASADGSTIVGKADVDIDLSFAFRWNASEGGMTKLDAFAATAVSADGTVVVGWEPAFRWTQANGMQDLGNPPGAARTLALALSADGSVLAGKATLSDEALPYIPYASFEAMIGDTGSTTGWLQPWLEDQEGMPEELQDWTLHEVVGVGVDSTYLYFAGNGTNPDGDYEAWWARVPKSGQSWSRTFRVPLLYGPAPYVVTCGIWPSRLSITLAVLSTRSFDVRSIVGDSIRFGNATMEAAAEPEYIDVDRDGLVDLVLQFELASVYKGLDCARTRTLRFAGTTVNGEQVLGKMAIQRGTR